MYYEFTLQDLKDIKADLESIEGEIQDSINTLSENSDGTTSGEYSTSVSTGVDEKINSLDTIKTKVQAFESRVDEIISAIKKTQAVEDEYQVFVYEPAKLNSKIESVKDILTMNNIEYKGVFELGSNYVEWEDSITAKLDNPDANIFDAIEEVEQMDDEKVFRWNRDVMHGLNDKLTEVVPNDFVNNIQNLDAIKSKLDELGILDEIKEIAEIIMDNGRSGHIEGEVTDVNGIKVQGTGEDIGSDIMDVIHTILTLGGLYPGIAGMICDIINGVLYLGEYLLLGASTVDDAIFSFLGVIPGLAAGGKSVGKTIEELVANGMNLKKIWASSSAAQETFGKFYNITITFINTLVNGDLSAKDGTELGFANWLAGTVSIVGAGILGG